MRYSTRLTRNEQNAIDATNARERARIAAQAKADEQAFIEFEARLANRGAQKNDEFAFEYDATLYSAK